MSVVKRNIFLNGITERMAYKSSAHPISKKYPVRQDYVAHDACVKLGNILMSSPEEIWYGSARTKFLTDYNTHRNEFCAKCDLD